jgi:hypothetical protein
MLTHFFKNFVLGKNNAFSSWKDKIKSPIEESSIGRTVVDISTKEPIINNKESVEGLKSDILIDGVSIKGNNPVKDRLIGEISKEDLRKTQLESLLEGEKNAYIYLSIYTDIYT